ncbi:MAG: glycoside hydrolase domain-containing protein [Planctomycetota bacterium]
MLMPRFLSVLLAAALTAPTAFVLMTESRAGGESRDITIWPEDSMVKVFRDAAPPKDPGPAVQVEAARNEVVSGQAVFWCARDAKGLKVRASELAREGGRGTIPAPRVRFVGYVLVKDGRQPGYQIRNRPAHYPDPLIEEESIDVPAGTAQPIWLTLKVPKDAAPGIYAGKIEAEAGVGGAAARTGLVVKVRVYPATLPDQRTLQVTNWPHLCIPAVAKAFGVEKLWSAEHWALLRNAARNMAAHRQNVIKVDPLDLAEFAPGADGGLRADFSRFDQFVQLFVDEGVVGRIEGADLATRKPGSPGQDIFRNPFVVRVKAIEDGKVVTRLVPPESPEAQKFCAGYLPALVAHLREKKWLDRYMQHLADEPTLPQIPSYRAVAALARKHAPGVKIIEAIFETREDLLGNVDVWVPKTSYWDLKFFGARQKAGEEVWLYTCWDPNGTRDLNRLIEYPLTRTRLLHWLNFATSTSGYLHWGWDHLERYRPEAVTFNWTPGDEWLIYPGKGVVLDSIRSEAMLEGIQDYELLMVLARQDPAAADRICRTLVKSREDFQDGAAELRSARRELMAK